MTQPMTLDLSAAGKGAEIGGDGFPTPESIGLGDAVSTTKKTPRERHLSDDPGVVNAMTARALADDDEGPVIIDGPPDTSTTLLAGYVDSEGVRHIDVELRELRGRDEEAMARAAATQDFGRYTDTIIRCGVVRIGDVEEPKELRKVLDTLLVGDRNLLAMEIRRLAYGDTMKMAVTCPSCSESFDIEYSFSSDVPLKQFEIEDAADKAQRTFTVTGPRGTTVKIRPVDGTSQKRVYTQENVKKNGEELNTLLLLELVTEVNGKPLRNSIPILDMPSRDRRHFLNWLEEADCGPDYDNVEQECPECMAEFKLRPVTLLEMFRSA